MSLNPRWAEKEPPPGSLQRGPIKTDKDLDRMAEIIMAAAKEYAPATGEYDFREGCLGIAKRLREAGYIKADPYILSFLDQLAHGLRDFRKGVQEIIHKVELLKLTDEKAGQILKIIERAKERRTR